MNYPGLAASPYHALAKRYMPKGAGSLLAFGIKGGYDAGVKFIEALSSSATSPTSATRSRS